ncbi:hypothetical protein M2651_10190 [Clostridium sp. SYSU_GA19001]|uniref:hypothetical protein n=1 Tax=Clostridium caldaquaticum TaxID=2940653 RepID=UPI0020778B78|nr:hypothetical protein [Clostridium caldaquaticum]MCM8711389.1 hypothetical protein [Clostridium caldaquaticum]
MKNIKIITILLTVFIMLMGVGYAAWNQDISIEAVSETGTFNVALENGTVAVYADSNNTPEAINQGITRIASATADGVSGTVNITNLYPGAKAVVTIPVKNTSTIPVKIENVALPSSNSSYDVSVTYPDNLAAVNGTGNIVFTVIVNDNAPENVQAAFNYSATFKQFNK